MSNITSDWLNQTVKNSQLEVALLSYFQNLVEEDKGCSLGWLVLKYAFFATDIDKTTTYTNPSYSLFLRPSPVFLGRDFGAGWGEGKRVYHAEIFFPNRGIL